MPLEQMLSIYQWLSAVGGAAIVLGIVLETIRERELRPDNDRTNRPSGNSRD